MEKYTEELLQSLFAAVENEKEPTTEAKKQAQEILTAAQGKNLTAPILSLFSYLQDQKKENGYSPSSLGIDQATLAELAKKHEQIDEHMVGVGGRLTQALPIAAEANDRVDAYLKEKDEVAPSGIELWDTILENQARIKKELSISEEDWNSFQGQIRHAIGSVDELAKVIDLPAKALESIARVTKDFRMRLTPYYTSLIMAAT